MYTLFLLSWVLIVFIAMPVLLVMLVVNLIRKKQKWKILVSFAVCLNVSVVCVLGAMFTVPEDMQKEMPTTTEETMVTTTDKATPPTTIAPPTTKPITPKVDAIVQEFVKLGFTEAEAKEMKKIFTTVGITEIHNVRYAVGNGIDGLQSFTCDIYDYHADKGGISLHFTIDKRQLCFISLDGIPTTKTDYAYINIFGNVKFKTSNSKKSVTLYDIWDENGEIDSNAMGYKAVFDYENKKITSYEE